MARMIARNSCRRIRDWLYSVASRHLDPGAEWLQNHISNCPRCRKRFAAYCKVNLALSLLKSQPHRFDLLMCDNLQAIGVLKHSLREAPKADKLRVAKPEPKLVEKCGRYGHSTANLAACVAVIFLMKIGVFSSMDKFQSRGQSLMKQYYSNHAGEDLANEVFHQEAE